MWLEDVAMAVESDDKVERSNSGVVGFVATKSDGMNSSMEEGMTEARVGDGVDMLDQVVCGQFEQP